MNKKIILLMLIPVLLTGCTKTLQDKDNKPVVNEVTGQNLTENILCRPTDEETIKLYKENGVEISGEDALDEEVSEAHAVPATGEDYTQASEQSELDRQTDADIANFFSSNGIFDALNDGQALMR